MMTRVPESQAALRLGAFPLTVRRELRAIAAGMLLIGTFVAAPSRAAGTLTFPGPAPCDTTPQACVAAASSGDTIELDFDGIGAGAGNNITISDKTLTLQAAAGRRPIIGALFVTSGKAAVDTVVVRGLALRYVNAACDNGGLHLTVSDNQIAGFSLQEGIQFNDVADRAVGANGCSLRAERNQFQISSASDPKTSGAIGAYVFTSPTTFDIVDNSVTVQVQNGAMNVISLQATSGSGVARLHRVVVDRNRIVAAAGAGFNSGIRIIAAGGSDSTVSPVRISADLVNNVVQGQKNVSGVSGGISVYRSGWNQTIEANIINNTVVDDESGIGCGEGGSLGSATSVALRNNIVAGSAQLGIGVDSTVTLASSNNIVFGNQQSDYGIPPGTIEADPRFVDRAAKNYRLAAGSPAIDAGLDGALPATYTFDTSNEPRRVGVIDIGAFEATQTTYTVSPSVSGTYGTISPGTAQIVVAGKTATFTLAPVAGYSAAVGGTCGGTLTGATYTTHPIVADCTVIASFALTPATPAVTTTTLMLAPNPAQVYQPITATVTVSPRVGAAGTPGQTSSPAAVGGTATISGGGASCVATLVSGVGTCMLSFAATGSYTLTATYSGDAANQPSSAVANLVVNATATPAASVAAPALSTWMLGLLAGALIFVARGKTLETTRAGRRA